MTSKTKLTLMSNINSFISDFLQQHPALLDKWLSLETQKKLGTLIGLKPREVIQGPQRNISAYLFFCDSKRKEILDKNPGIKPNKVMVIFGEQWRALSEEERKPFIEKAIVDRERYAKYLESRQIQKRNVKPSVYNMFCTDERLVLKETHPHLTNSEIRHILGTRWKTIKETNPDLLREKYGFVIKESVPKKSVVQQ